MYGLVKVDLDLGPSQKQLVARTACLNDPYMPILSLA